MSSFSVKLIDWQALYGRHHMPWQQNRTPYTVWLSEVMLQQTQVKTVLDYYPRFLTKFPTVQALAGAPLDDVLALWSGMGYYARARNMHRAACQVVQDFGGEFPKTAQQLEQLVGVGRSTAAAIAAFCYGERVAILDGNVKRVLARVLAFNGDLASSSAVNTLWDAASELLPKKSLMTSMPAYTQALMDMGATVCHARNPDCANCPVFSDCKAALQNNCEAYPVKTNKLKRSTESIWLLHATRDTKQFGALQSEVLLQQRPTSQSSKIWAGLYSLPPFESEEALIQVLPKTVQKNLIFESAFKHVLTHKDLWLHIVQFQMPKRGKLGIEIGKSLERFGDWHLESEALMLGLPAPIRKILEIR